MQARWGVALEGGEGFRAIARLLDSAVDYRRLDAFELGLPGETFDLIFCFGVLHRVENPLGLLHVLRRCLAPGGEMLIEAYGVRGPLAGLSALHVCAADELYARDEFVYWGFSGESLDRLARHAGFAGTSVLSTPTIDGHPRIVARLG